MALQTLVVESLITLPATGNVVRALGYDWRRVYAGFWAPPTVNTVYISPFPTVNQLSSAQLVSTSSNGPIWELYRDRHRGLVTHEWWLYGGGMPGANQVVIWEELEWDDARDTDAVPPPSPSDPHSGSDSPDRLRELLSDLLRLMSRRSQ